MPDIELTWTRQDNNPDGEWLIYRSQDGSLGTEITGGLSVSTESYTDSVDEGTLYYYTLRRDTMSTISDSAQESIQTTLSAPSDLTVIDTRDSEADIEFTDNASNKQGYRIELDEDEDGTWVQNGTDITTTVAEGQTKSVTVQNLTNGQLYGCRVSVFTDDAESYDGGEQAIEIPAGAINLNDQGLTQGDVIQNYWNETDDMVIEPGTYVWDGNGPSLDGYSIYGDGQPGDVTLDLQGGTLDGTFQANSGFMNIAVEGDNPAPKAGIDLYPGATVKQYAAFNTTLHNDEDRHFYTPVGGDDPITITQSSWANATDNGAYTDKPPLRITHCVAQDNNISNIRVGHRDGTSTGLEDHIEDSVISVVNGVTSHSMNDPTTRGLRVRHPTTAYVTRTLFDWRDVQGAGGGAIEFTEEATGGELHLDQVVIYNESSQYALNQKAGADAQIYIDGPVIVGGPGSLEIQGTIYDPDNNLTTDPSMSPPDWNWREVTYGKQSPVEGYFGAGGTGPLEDFEAADSLNKYNGGSNELALSTSTVLEGSQSLELNSDTGSYEASPYVTTDITIERGKTYSYLQQNSGGNNGGFIFGHQTTDHTSINACVVYLNSGGDLYAWEYSNGTAQGGTSSNVGTPTDAPIRMEIEWQIDDTVVATAIDPTNDSIYGSTTYQVTTFPATSGGAGWDAAQDITYVDDLKEV